MNRSWYVFLIQIAPLAERLLAADDGALVDRLWADWTSPGYARADDVKAWLAALLGPAGPSLALGHYRSLFAAYAPSFGSPSCPTPYLHGRRDGCIGAELVEVAELDLAEGSRIVMIDYAGCLSAGSILKCRPEPTTG